MNKEEKIVLREIVARHKKEILSLSNAEQQRLAVREFKLFVAGTSVDSAKALISLLKEMRKVARRAGIPEDSINIIYHADVLKMLYRHVVETKK